MEKPELLTYDQVAEFMQVDPRTVRNWVKRGRLVPRRMTAGTVRFRKTDLLQAMETYENGEPETRDPAMG